ncbi:MAG: methyltransferase domain-containing protein [Methyloceanibacter sp.]
MSSILRMPLSRSANVAGTFGARATSYEQYADLQRAVAERLARLLPPLARPRVLELGCGTGLFSRHLVARYPGSSFVLSDLAPAMIEECRRNLESGNGHLGLLLAPGGLLVYATISGQSFPEWRAVLAARELPSGLVDIPELPGIVDEERLVADTNALAFLRRLKAIGGLTPKEGYAPLSAGALRRAIRAADERHGGRTTWHIVYGRVGSMEASQSRPSISPA